MAIPDPNTLRRALDEYPQVVARQGVARLPELDTWYREELPALIASRTPGFITLDDLVRLTEWKMARGVWRAPNLALVRGNPSEEVEARSRKALAKVPHPTAPIAELAKLKGVGPATASAVAAAAAPQTYPFFDELVAAQLPDLGDVAWTMKFYGKYAAALQAAVHRLGEGWTVTLLERALWAHSGGKAGERPAGA
jgi:hypothetical protein